MRKTSKPEVQILSLLIASLLMGTTAVADDGQILRKSLSRAPGQPVTDPAPEAEHAFIDVMNFYVPAQGSNGDLATIEYYDIDGTLVQSRTQAKPLVSVYIYGPAEGVEGTGFVGHGQRDAFAAVSLDDGNTWKRTNLSDSADLSSITAVYGNVTPTDIDFDPDGPTITLADLKNKQLTVEGEDAPAKASVEVRNAVTQQVLASAKSKQDGEWKLKVKVDGAVPCLVQAGVDGVFGPAMAVEGATQDCTGSLLSRDYPGDVINIFHATAGNKVIVAWPSRYCESGSPNYSLEQSDSTRRELIAQSLGIDLDTASPDDLYLIDMYGVAGQQGLVDYREDRFEPNRAVGQVPFSCLWTARGTLEPDPETGGYAMVWRKPERLTSGVRDVNRVEVMMVEGVGAAITWQEDPEGLRPGQGEGPGEGWSGAIANSQTDVWYSFIEWNHFDLVEDPDSGGPIDLATYLATYLADNTTKPGVGIPMAMPMRLTDNAKCNVTNPRPYCKGSALQADNTDLPFPPMDYGLKDLCADTVKIPTGPQDTLAAICITEDGLPLVGNTASTRPRLGLYGYDSDGDRISDSGWVVVVAEESKGLGAFIVGDEVVDDGKNIWYHTFGMSLFDLNNDLSNVNRRDSLVRNLTSHGNMLNQPEVDWLTGIFYPVLNTADLWDFGAYNFDIYRTEIARRGSLLAQPIQKVGTSGLIALPAWKQGIMNQGGPADVMVRRILRPTNFMEISGENPYAFRNMECATWAYDDGSNPYYPDGLCLDPAINLSSVVPDTCIDSNNPDSETLCPTVDESGIGDTNPILQGNEVAANTTKVLTWHQCPAEFTAVSGETVACEEGDTNLADQSWYNPLDVAKGHRGFLDGDFVMMLYAWSPNWRLNRVGNDRYELYIRRSFDGAQSWTTLPGNYDHQDGLTYQGGGTTTCETYRTPATQVGGEQAEPHVCNNYTAGAPEQARNVSQLKSMAFTILDPRYTPTMPSIAAEMYGEEDVRDPTRYFIVYETGDNTTAAEGEAEPLNLYYGRGVMFGDHYQVWAEEDNLEECYPSVPYGDASVAKEVVGSGFCNEFDSLEGRQDVESSEASLKANPGGEFMYGVWAQHEISTGESDAMFRRVWYIDDYISETNAWDVSGQGTSQ